MKLGLIGVGHLAVSMLKGFLAAGRAPGDIVLSPRGHGPEMAQSHGFALARDNADLVSRCDIVLLAVRSNAAADVIEGLPWRADQVVVSACAGVPIAQLAGAAAPAQVVRVMPQTACELGASPTAIYPRHAGVSALLSDLGAVIALENEDQFEAATVSAGMYGWAQALIRAGADWSAAQGLDEATARELVARSFVAAGRMVAEQQAPMADILAGLATPGGITEAGLNHLRDRDVPQAWDGACDLVLAKLRQGS